jgi:hypothetical protein
MVQLWIKYQEEITFPAAYTKTNIWSQKAQFTIAPQKQKNQTAKLADYAYHTGNRFDHKMSTPSHLTQITQTAYNPCS